MLPIVHAYRDDGPQAEYTRWKPRRVFCTLEADHTDAPGTLYVAKLATGVSGAAALISEVVSTRLLSIAGFRTLSSVIIRVGEGYAASCNSKSDYPGPISVGDYYATVHRNDVEAGPPPSYDFLADPHEVLRLWVFDTWLANIDRERQGNMLLALATGGKFRVIAADQSDCFCGAGVFCSSSFQKTMRRRGPASSVGFLPRIILDHGGPQAIRKAVSEARYFAGKIQEALDLVPAGWWYLAGLSAKEVRQALEDRADGLEGILKPQQWEISNVGDALTISV